VSTSSSGLRRRIRPQLAAPGHDARHDGLEQRVELALGRDRAVAGGQDGGEQPGDLGVDGGRQAGEAGDDRAEGGAVGGGQGGLPREPGEEEAALPSESPRSVL
jgi:hypothetical protein